MNFKGGGPWQVIESIEPIVQYLFIFEEDMSLSDREKAIITEIPNFDKEIFKEITGIDVDL